MSNGMVITHNLSGMFTNRQLGIVGNNKAKSSEKLSSGYRINRAADDAAGLSISEKMRRQIRGLKQGAENMQDGISFCQTADGYLNEVVDMLHRMNELSVKAANGTNSASDRLDIDNEIQELKGETARIFETAKFNETYIFKVPYVPAPVVHSDGIQVFSNGLQGGTLMYGGIEVNDVRHTWDELGIALSADKTTFASDQTISFKDYTNELIELHVKAGDPLNQITRRNYWSADDQGVYINNKLAQTWNEIGIDEKSNQGEYSVKYSYKGEVQQEIFFEVNDGDSREDVIDNINGRLFNSQYSWDLSTSNIESSSALSIRSADTLTINNNSKEMLAPGVTYTIKAYRGTDEDSSYVTVKNSRGDSFRKMSWTEFKNILSGDSYPISDWGLTDRDNKKLESNLKSFDDTALYEYKNSDSNIPIEFTFTLSDEAGIDEAIAALDGAQLNKTVYSPNRISVTRNSSSAISPNVSFDTSSLSYDVMKDYGRNFNEANDVMTGDIDRKLVQESGSSESKGSAYAESAVTSISNGSPQSVGEFYYKDTDGKYYKINKLEESFTDTKTAKMNRTVTSSYHYSYTDPDFKGTTLDPIADGQTFNYNKYYTDDVKATGSHTVTSFDYDNREEMTGWDDDYINSHSEYTVVNNISTITTDTSWGEWQSTGTTLTGEGKDRNLRDTYTLTSSKGTLGTVTITDNGAAIGDSKFDINYQSLGRATASFSASANSTGNRSDHVEMRKRQVNVPLKELPIHASANNTDYIPLRWSGLNNAIIGIKGTNTETVQDARYAIDEIADAIKMVSDTRSTFGAQQNRFEHAIRQNNNTAENTQTAESLIRDTDMAKEMVKFSKERILEQAGQAMLTQADRTNEGVLSLLR